MGPTGSKKAPEGTIRHRYGTDIEKNAVHGSDGAETARFELGYFALRYPEEVGGQEADFATTCVLYEELAAGSLSLAAIVAMQGLMGTHFVYRYAALVQNRLESR